jgi:hypothetical protein
MIALHFQPHRVQIRKKSKLIKTLKGSGWNFEDIYHVVAMATEPVKVQPQLKAKKPMPPGTVEISDDDDEDGFDMEPAKMAPVIVNVIRLLLVNDQNGEYLWFDAAEVKFHSITC